LPRISVCLITFSVSFWFATFSYIQPHWAWLSCYFAISSDRCKSPTSSKSLPLSFFRFRRQILALFLFLKSLYSSEGKYLRIDISYYFVICSILIWKSPICTQSLF
jgi:hypothetical protein